MAQKEIGEAPASPYKHTQESVLRPDVGIEAQFAHKKAPRTYRYDSSLAPELTWDESVDRGLGEWLIGLITDAAEKGEDEVFAEPQVWQGTEERFSSLSQCAARLRSLTKPFLNWSGKAERHQVSVPTLPLFVHERHSTQAILETLQSHRTRGATLDLFGDVDLDIADKLDAYEHKGPWTNRLVLGDSLQVMNSLLEYEGKGQVTDSADAKWKAAQRWVDAVNRLGQHGVWHYLLVIDPGRLGEMLNAFTRASWSEGEFALS